MILPGKMDAARDGAGWNGVTLEVPTGIVGSVANKPGPSKISEDPIGHEVNLSAASLTRPLPKTSEWAAGQMRRLLSRRRLPSADQDATAASAPPFDERQESAVWQGLMLTHGRSAQVCALIATTVQQTNSLAVRNINSEFFSFISLS